MTYPSIHGRSRRIGMVALIVLVVVELNLARGGEPGARRAPRRRSPSAPQPHAPSDSPRLRAETLTATSVFAEAVAIARGIKNGGESALALAEIATSQANAGLTKQSRETFAKAVSAGRRHDEAKPPTYSGRDSALAEVADAQIEAKFLADAASTVGMTQSPGEQLRTCDALVEAQVRAGLFDQAMAVARTIKGNEHRADALREIAVAQAKAGQKGPSRQTFARVLETVKSEKDVSDWDLGRIAHSEIEAGLFFEAVALIDQVKLPGRKLWLLSTLGREKAKSGQSDGARHDFQAAERLIARFDDDRRLPWLIEIATAQADGKMTAEAVKTFRDATALARKAEDKAPPAGKGAGKHVATEVTTEAAEVFRKAIALVQWQGDIVMWWESLEHQAAKCAEQGKTEESAAVHKAVAGLMRLRIGAGQARVNATGEAAENFRQAVVLAAKWADVQGLMAMVAASQLKAGMKSEACETFRQAAATAAGLDAGERWPALLEIAAVQAEAGMMQEAAQSFAQAASAVARLSKQKERTKAALSIAFKQATVKLFAEALATLRAIRDEKCSGPNRRGRDRLPGTDETV